MGVTSTDAPPRNGTAAIAGGVTLPSLRRLVGDVDAAVSLSGPTDYDVAAGHALLRAVGGELVDARGRPFTYGARGTGPTNVFGAHPDVAVALATRGPRQARATRGANLANDGQHHVFAGQAFGQHAIDLDAHVFGFFGQQGLGGQHMLNLRGANAMGQCAKGTMGTGMRIATHDRHTRQSGALLRPDDVNDALTQIIHLELRNTKGGAVLI
jgi:hypothetical protein